MKKNILAVVLASACGLSAMSANAADGTITFNGKITDSTCDVALSSPGANGGKDLVVELGAFHKGKIVNANEIMSERDLTFKLSNCPADMEKVGILFEGDKDADIQDAFANISQDKPAVGVAVKLMDGANSVAPGSLPVMKDLNNGALDINYKAQFITTKAVGEVVSGKYKTIVNYTMNYQ